MEVVAIVGVGLIGGSFALALRKAGFRGRILGVSSPATVAEALRRGVIDEPVSLHEAARRSDLLYLSQPIRRILETIAQLEGVLRPEALVTDAGSTKAEICRAAGRHLKGARFLGGHPMAGKESRGVAEAEPDLFRDRTYVLTPGAPEDLEWPQAVEFVDWIRRIGARPVVIEAEEHDRLVAFTSHLPQLASTALAAMLEAREQPERLEEVAGPGLRDMTRLALSPFDVWRDILETNSEAVRAALDAYIRELEAMRASLGENLEEEFGRGADFARRLRAR